MCEKFFKYVLWATVAVCVLTVLGAVGWLLRLVLFPMLAVMLGRNIGAGILLGLGILTLGVTGIRALCR